MSSPGTYLRCSENSTEKPWNGLACRPLKKPSTMNLARKSRRPTWRITSGRRYFSVLMPTPFYRGEPPGSSRRPRPGEQRPEVGPAAQPGQLLAVEQFAVCRIAEPAAVARLGQQCHRPAGQRLAVVR